MDTVILLTRNRKQEDEVFRTLQDAGWSRETKEGFFRRGQEGEIGRTIQLVKADGMEELAFLWENPQTIGIVALAGEPSGFRKLQTERPAALRRNRKTPGKGGHDGILRDAASYGKMTFSTGLEAAAYANLLIRMNYRRNYAARDYADRVSLEPSYLCRLFKKLTGATIGDTIWRLRMEKARELLLSTDDDPGEIASSVGYTSTSYFRRRFEEFYSVSPENLRMQNQKAGSRKKTDR